MTWHESVTKLIDKIEGGYSDDKDDKGGKTRYGITEELARDYGYKGDMKDLPRSNAESIYYLEFWQPVASLIYPYYIRLADEIFESTVNHGKSAPAQWLQQALNALNRCGTIWPNLEVDGHIGARTISALNSAIGYGEKDRLLLVYSILRGYFYIRLTQVDESQEKWFRGWLSRLEVRV